MLRKLLKIILLILNLQTLLFYVFIWLSVYDIFTINGYVQKYLIVIIHIAVIINILSFIYELIKPEKIRVVKGPQGMTGPMGPRGQDGITICHRCRNYDELTLTELLSKENRYEPDKRVDD